MTRPPLLAPTREALSAALAPTGQAAGSVVLVPTMGALHRGHGALLDAARRHADIAGRSSAVVASVFVNPLQFGTGEDLSRYPRTFDADLALCGEHGVDVVFAPTVEEMYPEGEPSVTVDPGPLGERLEGQARPGHFRGVLTVVAKLFGLVRPEVAVFGEKDYQQLVLVRQMSRDLCLGVEVVGEKIVREADGLALSSRNRFLDADQRRVATALSRALEAARRRAPYGLPAARWAASRVLTEAEPEADIDYLEILGPDLEEIGDEYPTSPTPARALVAARVGSTRLIDNMALVLGDPAGDGA